MIYPESPVVEELQLKEEENYKDLQIVKLVIDVVTHSFIMVIGVIIGYAL